MPLNARYAQVLSLREKSGKTFTAIGVEMGITKARVSAIYKMAKRIQKFDELGETKCPTTALIETMGRRRYREWIHAENALERGDKLSKRKITELHKFYNKYNIEPSLLCQ